MEISYDETMFTKADHLYKILNDIDLGGKQVALPVNATLSFEGGRILNGSLVLSNTLILGATTLEDVFVNVTLTSTYRPGQVLQSKKNQKVYYSDENGALVALAAKFRWNNDVIQISYDNGESWTNFSPVIGNGSVFAGIADTTEGITSPKEGGLYLIGTTEAGLAMYLYTASTWKKVGDFNTTPVGLVNTFGASEAVAISQNSITKAISEINISDFAGNSEVASLEAAIQLVPEALRKQALKITFIQKTAGPQTWQFVDSDVAANFLKSYYWRRIDADNVYDGGTAYSLYGGARHIDGGKANG